MGEPGYPVNCPHCGRLLQYIWTQGETHFYRCAKDGTLILPPGRASQARRAGELSSTAPRGSLTGASPSRPKLTGWMSEWVGVWGLVGLIVLAGGSALITTTNADWSWLRFFYAMACLVFAYKVGLHTGRSRATRC